MPKRLPSGVSNYEKLITENYYYVDKTKYIEKLENYPNPNIMLLRPRKFGKSLFISVLNYYYDINQKYKFEELFKETYIGKNPTRLKNSYYMLNFDFSGIDTTSVKTTIDGFKMKTNAAISEFVAKYGLEFSIDKNDEAEEVIYNLLKAFALQKSDEKMYVLIDEYDHFANELLGFHTGDFKDLVSKNGKVRKWYEILKEGTKTVVDRIFMTGVAPITLDSMTSGFNIVKDLTRDVEYNEIFGFTEEELLEMIKQQGLNEEIKEEILPIMRENYDGYRFSVYAQSRMYNANMCLNFLDDYVRLGKLPEKMVDVNIISDYKKLGNMLNLCQGEEREKIIENSISGVAIPCDITQKFNPAKEFTTTDLVSMLFYLGYLTIVGESLGDPELKIPNKVMKEIYAEYFLKTLTDDLELGKTEFNYNSVKREIAFEGKIDKLVEIAGEYLNRLSNRDYIKFDEKYVKIVFFSIAMNLNSAFFTKSEMEVQRKYPDLLITPKEAEKDYYSVMIEFKYLKSGEETKLIEKQKEAKIQLNEYAEFEEIRKIKKLRCYTIVAVNGKLYVEKV